MTMFNGYYRDEEMSGTVYRWIKALEADEAKLKLELDAAKVSNEQMRVALEAIKSEVGTSTLAHKIASEALKAPSSETKGGT